MYEQRRHPPRRRPSTRLKLDEVVVPATSEGEYCGVVWEHDAQVRLLSSVLRGSCSPTCPGLDDVLGWLDAACYAASSTSQVSRACASNSQWHLRCIPFDGSDRALLVIADLLRACARRTRS